MANDLTHNPWSFDSADANAASKSKALFIKRVVWKTPATHGDKLIIKDQNGVIVVDAVCEVDGQSQVFLIEHSFDGLNVNTVDSGLAYVYLN